MRDSTRSGSAAVRDPSRRNAALLVLAALTLALPFAREAHAAPGSDSFAGATTLTLSAGTATGSGSNSGAGTETGEPLANSNAATVWYKWTAAATGPVRISLQGSNYRTTLGVYTGTAVNALTLIVRDANHVDPQDASNFIYADSVTGHVYPQSRVGFRATSGVIYRIQIGGFGGATGNYSLTLTAATNDNFAAPTTLTAGTPVSGFNDGAITETGESSPYYTDATMWFRWTAPSSGPVVASLKGSSFNTTLAVYTGAAFASLVYVAYNDDYDFPNDQVSGVVRQSRADFYAVAGTVYQIQVGGFLDVTHSLVDAGDFVIALNTLSNVGGNWSAMGPAPGRGGLLNIPAVSPINEVCGAVQAIAVHPTVAATMYVGTVGGGIWKTTTAATTLVWTPQTDAQRSLTIGAIEFDPTDGTRNTLVASCAQTSMSGAGDGRPGGVLLTTNGGATWSALENGWIAFENLTSVAARLTPQKVILAASDNAIGSAGGSGLFRSTDAGLSWTLISGSSGTGLPAGPVSDLVGDPGNNSVFYAAVRTAGVFKSTDYGATWSNVTTGISGITSGTAKIELAVHNNAAGGTNAVYAAVVNSNGVLSGVFRSANQGGSWTQMDTPAVHNAGAGYFWLSIAASPTNANIVYIGGDYIASSPFTGNLFRGDATLSAGNQFVTIMDANGGNTTPHWGSRDLAVDAAGNLIEADEGGLYKRSSPTSSAGAWTSLIGNLAVMETHDVAYDAVARVPIAGTYGNGAQMQSANGSSIWNTVFLGGGDVATDNGATTQSVRYGGSENLTSFWRKTYNASNALTGTTSPALAVQNGGPSIVPQYVTPIETNRIAPTRLIIGGGNAAYESTDGGATVTALTPASGVNGTYTGKPIAYGGRQGGTDYPDVLYYGAGATVKFRETAGGSVADTAALPVYGGFAPYVEDIVMDPADYRRVFVADFANVFFSTDKGAHWKNITTDVDNSDGISIVGSELVGVGSLHSIEFFKLDGTDALAVGTDTGVYCCFALNAGVFNWVKLGSSAANLPNAPVYDIAYNAAEKLLVVATQGRGVFGLNVGSKPVVTLPGAATAYAEDAVPSFVDATATVSDPDSDDFNWGNLTVDYTASGNAVDQLTINNQGTATGQIGVSGSNVTFGGSVFGTFAGGTGTTPLVVTFNSTLATPLAAQALARNILYKNTSQDPAAGGLTRTVRFVVSDGDGSTSVEATKTINISVLNDAPTVTPTAGSATYAENAAAVAIDATLTTADVDNANYASATVAITGGTFAVGEDVLSFTNTAAITGTYNPVTGVMSLSGPTTKANYQAALRTVKFADTSENPSTGTRQITFTVNDGNATNNTGSAARTLLVTAANDAPVVSTTASNLPYAENQAATAIDPGFVVTDVDSANLASATVAITVNGNPGQDVLSFVNQNGITGSFNAAQSLMSLSGSAPVATYQAALRTVTYHNSSDNPTSATRTVTFAVNDGSASNNSASASRGIAITTVNDAPLATTTAANLAYAENQAATPVDSLFVVTDADSATLSSATVAITANGVPSEDVLLFADQNGITGNFNAGQGSLSLTGSATVATYQAALRTVSYSNSSDNPSSATRTVAFTVNDGSASNNTATASRGIAITPANDAPVLTATAGGISYAPGQAATPVDASLSASDTDSASFVSATVTISSGLVSSQDVLSIPSQSGISGSYDASAGVLTISGAALVPTYQAALRTVTYFNSNSSPSTSTRTVTFTVNDGGSSPNVGSMSRTITITNAQSNQPPTLTTTAAGLSYVENQAATAVDPGITLTDSDGTTIASATVQITSGYVNGEDVLSFTNTAQITGIFTAANGRMALSGTTTLANYQAALASVRYADTSENPSTATRAVTFTADDGAAANSTGVATRTIAVTAANDAPVVAATAAALAYVENQAATPVDSAIAVSDVDGSTLVGASVQITGSLAPAEDLLSFTNTAQITGSYDANAGRMTLSGTTTLANYQAALASVRYLNSSENPSTATRTVTFTADDGGATNRFGSTTRTITVAAVNDAPVVTATAASLAYSENQAATAIDPGITVTDADGSTLTGASVQITGNLASAEDALSFTNTAQITGSYDAAAGRMSLSGTTTLANYQAALASVKYANASENPSALTRTVTFTADDGGAANRFGSTTRSIAVAAVNDAPVVTATAAGLAYAENQGATAVDPGIAVTDLDGPNLVGATVQITGNLVAAEDVLAFTSTAQIAGAYDSAAGRWTLVGTTTLANYQAALRSVTYANTSENPSASPRTVTLTVDDGGTTNRFGSTTRTIAVSAVNDAPVVTATAAALSYVENQAATPVDPGFGLSDIDSPSLAGATVQITGNLASAEDSLSFANTAQISGVYDAPTGLLTLVGATTLANFQAALASVTYGNSAENPSTLTRTVTFTVTDGSATNNLGSAARTIVVVAVDDAPVVTATAAALPYVENQAATAVDAALTVADVDGTTLVGATIAVTANFASGEDVLSFVNQGGITGSYDAAGGVMTLSGTTSLANYQTALRSVTYRNTSENPSSAVRTVTFTVTDAGSGTNTGSATRTITVTPVNDAPVATASSGSLAYVENQAATAVDAGFTTTDVDSANLTGAAVAITANFAAGQDVLSFTDQGGIAGSYDAGTGVLALSGGATVAAYQNALRTVAYSNSSDTPSALTRTVAFTVNDGGAANNTGSATRTISVTPVNDAPVVTATASSLAYLENQAATVVDAALTAIDVDAANLVGATVAVTGNFAVGQDVLSFTNQSGITGNFVAGTGVLTLSGTTTVANYQAALRTVKYANSSENPSALPRTVTFTANDGGAANNLGSATRTIAVTPVNDAPVVTTTAAALAYVENQAATSIDPGVTTTDVDGASFVGATAAITANFASGQDVLSFTNQGGITGGYDAGAGVLTLAGVATAAAYQAALRSVAYSNSSDNPSTLTRTVAFTVDDGGAANNFGSATRAIALTAVNDAPALTTSPGSLAYVENQAATAVDAALSAIDPDTANFVGATVAITTGFASGQDVLSFVNQGGITGNYNAGTGVLTLSGAASTATYQAALRAVAYANSSENPSVATRTVTLTANDGSASNNLGSATRTITVTAVNDAPVLTTTAAALAYVENQAATAVDPGVTATDVDGASFVGATVAVTGNFASGQDVLSFVDQGGITGNYSAASGVLTLTGGASVAAYQAALRTVRYSNSSENPSALTRTITFTADDGGSANNLGAAGRTVTVTPVNDAPVATTSTGAVAYVENQAATAIDPAITTTDVDSATFTGATVAIIANFAAGQDVLSFVDQGGITGSYSTATGVLTLTGAAAPAAYQAALRVVVYSNSSDNPSAATRTVRFTVNDGAASNNLGSATRTISVTPVNDAPVVTTTAAPLAYVENQAPTPVDAALAAVDVDNANLVGATVAITAGFVPGQDVLSFANQGPIAGAFNAATGVLTLSGAAGVAVYQSALRAVTYSNASDSPVALTRTVTFTVNDGAAVSNLGSASRAIGVVSVNDAPTFDVGPDQSVAQEAGPQAVVGFARNISAGSPDESGQTLNFLVTVDRPEIFATQPAVSPDGTLTYAPSPDASDTAIVTVRLHDDGGTADGGVDTSARATFAISVTSIVEEIGVYTGVALPDVDAEQGADKTGLLNLSLAAKGKVRGALKLGPFTFPFTGAADNAGVVHFGKSGTRGPSMLALKRKQRPDLALTLRIDASGRTERLTGAITEDGAPFATIAADRAAYTSKKFPAPPLQSVPAELLGNYTATFGDPQSADLDPSQFPHGAGFVVLRVARDGIVTLSGSLADGSKVSCKSPLSRNNDFPIWIPLAKGAGALVGVAHLEPAADGDVTGLGMLWFRPPASGRFYPEGWPSGIATDLAGSLYVLPPKSEPDSVLPGLGPVDEGGNATLVLVGGGLDDGLTKTLDIDLRNKVRVLDADMDASSVKFAANVGSFKGSFVHPFSGRKTTFQGVVLQKQGLAIGYFVGPDDVGTVTISPGGF